MTTTNTIRKNTTLHKLVLGNDYSIVEKYIEKNINTITDKINVKNKYKNTPLLYACWNCNLEIIKLLVKYGADINIADKDGDTVLIISSWYSGNYDIIDFLIKNGANVFHKNFDGLNAYNIAVMYSKNPKMITLLRNSMKQNWYDKQNIENHDYAINYDDEQLLYE